MCLFLGASSGRQKSKPVHLRPTAAATYRSDAEKERGLGGSCCYVYYLRHERELRGGHRHDGDIFLALLFTCRRSSSSGWRARVCLQSYSLSRMGVHYAKRYSIHLRAHHPPAAMRVSPCAFAPHNSPSSRNSSFFERSERERERALRYLSAKLLCFLPFCRSGAPRATHSFLDAFSCLLPFPVALST
uniref:Uncharacterized protein n=1 Tax=Pseudictyota dubia TaxID=2749911 RepID=A0A7R9ZF44_9STRA